MVLPFATFCDLQEVNLGVAGFTISQVREEGIYFTIPFYEEPSAILTPPPKAGSKLFAVVQPFSWEVSTEQYLQN